MQDETAADRVRRVLRRMQREPGMRISELAAMMVDEIQAAELRARQRTAETDLNDGVVTGFDLAINIVGASRDFEAPTKVRQSICGALRSARADWSDRAQGSWPTRPVSGVWKASATVGWSTALQ